ncbi:alpha-galactosidase [Schaalia naturae]|uniref:Alpha-galactosidase n=1 Tax=Schaalia naturae TaxID=635203 RepID=A0ABW2SMN3_9ACTO
MTLLIAGPSGFDFARGQVRAVREQCPGLEIESCASGGARGDLEILQRTQRVWASDRIDAIKRQDIQRWTSQLIPLEMIGAHIETGCSHTTGRRLPLPLRAATALFGHFGIEWDITEISQEEHRALLHSGRLVRRGAGWLGGVLWGVVSEDRAEALYALDILTRTPASPGSRSRSSRWRRSFWRSAGSVPQGRPRRVAGEVRGGRVHPRRPGGELVEAPDAQEQW